MQVICELGICWYDLESWESILEQRNASVVLQNCYSLVRTFQVENLQAVIFFPLSSIAATRAGQILYRCFLNPVYTPKYELYWSRESVILQISTLSLDDIN